MVQSELISMIFTSSILYLHAHLLLAEVLTWKFDMVPDYYPAPLPRYSFSRSRGYCALICARDDTCAGFTFLQKHGRCTSYGMGAGRDTIQFASEPGINSYIKGRSIKIRIVKSNGDLQPEHEASDMCHVNPIVSTVSLAIKGFAQWSVVQMIYLKSRMKRSQKVFLLLVLSNSA